MLERKYSYLCPPEYVEEVVSSISDDPLCLREPRYPAVSERSKSRAGVVRERRCTPPLVVNEKHDIHHVRERGYIEAPVRVNSILESLDASGMFQRVPAKQHPLDVITEVHDPGFVRYLQRACAGVPEGKSLYPYAPSPGGRDGATDRDQPVAGVPAKGAEVRSAFLPRAGRRLRARSSTSSTYGRNRNVTSAWLPASSGSA